jgi:hypothetical protein
MEYGNIRAQVQDLLFDPARGRARKKSRSSPFFSASYTITATDLKL